MMAKLPDFADRRAELQKRLSWARLRSPQRRQLQAELRELVRDELAAELRWPAKAPQIATEASPPADLFSRAETAPPISSAANEPYGGKTPYWVE